MSVPPQQEVTQLLLAWSEGVRHTSRDEFIDHCTSLAVVALGLETRQ